MASINANGECYFYNEYPVSNSTIKIPRTQEQKKQWKLNRTKREVQNATAYLFYNRVNVLKFYTFTLSAGRFLELKSEHGGLDSALKSVSANFSQLLTNMRNNYGLMSYVWTREFTKKKTPHFHSVLDIAKVKSLPRLSLTWGRMNGFESNNSIDAEYIRGYGNVIKYISKYLTKESYKGGGRSFGMSQNLMPYRKPVKMDASYLPDLERSRVKQLNEFVSLYEGSEISDLYNEIMKENGNT